jgi:hypothetical protein
MNKVIIGLNDREGVSPYFEFCSNVVYKDFDVEIGCGVTLLGTVFPFVRWVDTFTQNPIDDFNSLFPVVVSLKSIPSSTIITQFFDELKMSAPLYTDTVIYYDGSIFAQNTPKSPGIMGRFDNFGYSIDWYSMGAIGGLSTSDTLQPGEQPTAFEGMTVGLFRFEGIEVNNYILEIKRAGFMTRWSLLELDPNIKEHHLGHRELIAGDINTDLTINSFDAIPIRNAMGLYYYDITYNPMLNLLASGNIRSFDLILQNRYIGFWAFFYDDTLDLINRLGLY